MSIFTTRATAGVILTFSALALPAGIAAQTSLPASSAGDRAAMERSADSLYAARNYRAALDVYRRLTRIDSTTAKYWSQLGMAAAQNGDYATAVQAFKHASANRGGPPAVYNVGAMFARLGQPDSAFAWLTTAIQIGFADTATLSTDDDISSLRTDPRFKALRESVMRPPSPCANDTLYRRFDFWAGNWRVTTPGGTQVGSSHVDIVSGGCALLENWRDMRGSEGKSLNTYDPGTRQWRQFWVGQGGGVTDYSRSEWTGKTLSFYATAPASQGKPAVTFRLSFTALEPNIVQQHGEVSRDDGKTWATTYDFRYNRVPQIAAQHAYGTICPL
jgi:hypothetical protein